MIKITNLNKYFYKNKSNQIHVINNTSIEFPETGLVAIHGESGCGKTTLLNVIGGLDDFNDGIIEIDNFKIKKYSSRVIDRIRNEKIGYIFQNYLLLQQRTVYENLKLILNMYQLSQEEIDERIDYVLNAVGMLKHKKKNVSELSGGQQQRVSIARALIKSPSLILADEPTGNLDEKNTIEIMNILKKISKTTLVILVSHEQNIVNSYSDYIIKIKDGKVISTESTNGENIYKPEDDQNIYLKEYKYTKIESENVSVDFYSNDKENIKLEIVHRNGKFYIKTSNNAIYLEPNSEVKFINDYKKDIDTNEEVLNSDYEIEKIENARNLKLPLKEQIRLAKSGLSEMKKRTLFLSFPLFVIIILMLLSVQSLVSAGQINRQELFNTHSNIYNISLEKSLYSASEEAIKYGFELFYDDFIENNSNIEPLAIPATSLKYSMDAFSQIIDAPYEFGNFSLLTTEQVKAENLIYGRMPENSKEIIVEKWVLENLFNSTTLGNFMTLKSFIGETIRFKPVNFDFQVVGIADSDENAIYINKWRIFDIILCGFRLENRSVGSLSELKKFINDDSLSLDDDEIYWNDSNPFVSSQGTIVLNQDSNLVYKLKEAIDCGECPFDVIVSDNQYDRILKSVMKYNWKKFNVYCENEEEKRQVDEYIASVQQKYESGKLYDDEGKSIYIKLLATSEYDKLLAPYEEEANKLISSRIVLTVTILFISVLIVFFLMKSYAIKNIYDIGVFRAIGISKRSIIFIYALEMLIISLKTTLIGGVLVYLITNIIASVPLIDVSFAVSFPLFIIGTFGLIVINVIVGSMSVMGYLRLTPSKILTKYDA